MGLSPVEVFLQAADRFFRAKIERVVLVRYNSIRPSLHISVSMGNGDYETLPLEECFGREGLRDELIKGGEEFVAAVVERLFQHGGYEADFVKPPDTFTTIWFRKVSKGVGRWVFTGPAD